LPIELGHWDSSIKVAGERKAKTAFRTLDGFYGWEAMPFSLTNAPTYFVDLTNRIFKVLVNKILVVFVDNILVFSKIVEEHEEHLRKVLENLMEH